MAKKLTDAQKEAYVKRPGMRCPFCGNIHVSLETPDFADNGVEVDGSCADCGETWTEVYRIVTIVTEADKE